MPDSEPKISNLYSDSSISRIVNMTFSNLIGGVSIHNIIRVAILLPGLLLTVFMVKFRLEKSKSLRRVYLWIYFLGILATYVYCVAVN